MSDDLLRRAIQRGGCRLCLAPDTECVPIFATAAADKEPLSSKIHSCVNIRVSHLEIGSRQETMRLSNVEGIVLMPLPSFDRIGNEMAKSAT